MLFDYSFRLNEMKKLKINDQKDRLCIVSAGMTPETRSYSSNASIKKEGLNKKLDEIFTQEIFN